MVLQLRPDFLLNGPGRGIVQRGVGMDGNPCEIHCFDFHPFLLPRPIQPIVPDLPLNTALLLAGTLPGLHLVRRYAQRFQTGIVLYIPRTEPGLELTEVTDTSNTKGLAALRAIPFTALYLHSPITFTPQVVFSASSRASRQAIVTMSASSASTSRRLGSYSSI